MGKTILIKIPQRLDEKLLQNIAHGLKSYADKKKEEKNRDQINQNNILLRIFSDLITDEGMQELSNLAENSKMQRAKNGEYVFLLRDINPNIFKSTIKFLQEHKTKVETFNIELLFAIFDDKQIPPDAFPLTQKDYSIGYNISIKTEIKLLKKNESIAFEKFIPLHYSSGKHNLFPFEKMWGFRGSLTQTFASKCAKIIDKLYRNFIQQGRK